MTLPTLDIQNTLDQRPKALCDPTVQILLGLHILRIWRTTHLWLFQFTSKWNFDLSPRVLWIQWFRSHRNFTFRRVGGWLSSIILFAVILDPTVVGPRCSDPTDHICTSPLRFLWSLDSDPTDVGYLGLVIQRPLSLLLLSFGFLKSLRIKVWIALFLSELGLHTICFFT